MKNQEVKLRPVKEVITKEDADRTNRKFLLWDSFVRGDEGTDKYMALLQDPTVFAYAHLKNEDMQPLRMRPFQDLLINDKNRFVVAASANQVGKTLGAEVKTIHHAMYVPNSTVLMTSRTIDQSRMILRGIKELCIRSSIDLADDDDNKSIVSIRSDDRKSISKIVCVSPGEAALGYAPTLVVLDELGFVENSEHFYNQIIEPRIGHTQHRVHPFLTLGQIFAISNPNSTRGALWKLWNDARYSRYRFDWLVHPDNTKAAFENYRKTLPQDVFDSCYAAVFSSASGRFITREEYNAALDRYQLCLPSTAPVYFGLDIAGEDVKSRNTDRSVLFGFINMREVDEEGRQKLSVKMVYYRCFPPRTQRKVIYDEIKRLSLCCNFCGFSYDKMGGGDTTYNTLTDPSGPYRIPNYLVHPQTFSLQNKSEIYRCLKELYQLGRIKHPEIPDLRKELETLDFEKTEGGHYKVHHFKKSMKDDHPDAEAMACFEAVRMSKSQVSITTIANVHGPRHVF